MIQFSWVEVGELVPGMVLAINNSPVMITGIQEFPPYRQISILALYDDNQSIVVDDDCFELLPEYKLISVSAD